MRKNRLHLFNNNRALVITALIILIAVLMYISTGQALGFSGKKGSVYTVTDGEQIRYGNGEGGYSNSRLTDLDDGLGIRYSYCVQPDKPSPTATRATVDRVVTDEADTGKWNALRNIIFYSPSYPGYEGNVKGIKEKYYTGTFSKDWGIAHMALSYVYAGRPEDMATFGNTRASDLGEVWSMARKLGDAMWKDGTAADDAVHENFKIFICNMEGVQDMVVGYMEAPGRLTVRKSSGMEAVSSGNASYSLKGAEYTVYDGQGNERGIIKTDERGEGSELELPEGEYTVKETVAPRGYSKDLKEYSVKLVSDEKTVLDTKDTPITAKIDLLIRKSGSGYPYEHGEGNAKLENAVFKVDYFSDRDNTEIAKPIATWYFSTDDRGRVSGSDPIMSERYKSSDLYMCEGKVVFPLGKYVIREEVPPKGYLTNERDFILRVEEDGSAGKYTTSFGSTVVYDEIIRGGVRLSKVDKDKGGKVPQGDAELIGAEFSVFNESENSVAVGGRVFAPGAEIMKIKTDEKGVAATSDDALPYGSYSVRETKASRGYTLNETWTGRFSIEENGAIIDFSDKKVEEKVFIGGIKLYKTDSELDGRKPQGDGTLEGAEFTVYNQSAESVYIKGKEYRVGEAVAVITTDSRGEAETGLILPYGTYKIRETKPSRGYLLNEAWEERIEIRKNKTVIELSDSKIKEQIIKGGLRLRKKDAFTEDGSAQGDGTLEGAELTVKNISESSVVIDGRIIAPGEDCIVVRTDENGIAATDKCVFPYGRYSVRETGPSEGYLINGEWSAEFAVREEGQILDLQYDPVLEDIKRGGICILKEDTELGRSEAMAGTDLEDIVLTVRNVSSGPVLVRSELGGKDASLWDQVSKKDMIKAGKIKMVKPGEDAGTISFKWNEDRDAYTAETLPDDLPYGTYTVRESGSNSYYQRSDLREIRFTIRDEGVIYHTDDAGDRLVFKNRVYRSDIQGTKIADSTSERLGLIPFIITNVSSGERHVVVSDRNGFFTTRDRRTEDELNEEEGKSRELKVNSFDDILDKEVIKYEDIEQRYTEVRLGVWFGTGEKGTKSAPEGGKGALPCGTYTIEEMRCEQNEGYGLQVFTFTVEEKSLTGLIDLETVTDDIPEIRTRASVNGKNRDVEPKEEVRLTDIVDYYGLKRGESYSLKGRLSDRESGETVTDKEGIPIVSEKTFTAAAGSGRVKMIFDFNAENLNGRDTVVFEYLYDSEGRITAIHEDPDDEFQRVSWKSIDVPDAPSEAENPDEPEKPKLSVEPDKPDISSKTDKPESPGRPERVKVPKTGDGYDIDKWSLLIAVSGLSVLIIMLKRRREL